MPSYNEGGGYSGGYGGNSYSGGGSSFGGGSNSFKGARGKPQQKGNGKRMERSKWLRMYWARKNSKVRLLKIKYLNINNYIINTVKTECLTINGNL
jgi:hypothetical protein